MWKPSMLFWVLARAKWSPTSLQGIRRNWVSGLSRISVYLARDLIRSVSIESEFELVWCSRSRFRHIWLVVAFILRARWPPILAVACTRFLELGRNEVISFEMVL